MLGVLLRTKFDFPVKVSINAGDVGGPSAGMMFSLAIFDKLTPGALTGGAKIAGTGTIAGDGKVGPIGGIQQKLVGARDGGARGLALASTGRRRPDVRRGRRATSPTACAWSRCRPSPRRGAAV